MSRPPHNVRQLSLPSPEATCALARRIGAVLGPGDVILLDGPVGAGKTHFARCLIQSILTAPEDVPSPTFTLVQTYDTRLGELWHADLYRLGSSHEIEELGLADAFDTAICLVEWPDRLGCLSPAHALHVTLGPGPAENARNAQLQSGNRKWDRLLGEVCA